MDVQCDIDEICSKTNAHIDDEDEFMNLGIKENDVVYLWTKITAISRTEKYEKQKNKDILTFYLKTLEKMEFVFKNVDWSLMNITKKDAIYYIQTFHSVYINTLVN